MRPVDKGESPKQYKQYQDARDDLFNRLGMYCSYCEMVINHSAEVEHIVPRHQGGDELSWENFLLSCKYCNTIKSANNLGRENYLWPDKHNTFKAFIYDEIHQVLVNNELTDEEKEYAKNTIELLGLDRYPGKSGWKNHKDTRYMTRNNAWTKAKNCLNDYKECMVPQVARTIARVASSSGHFSIWMEVFKDYNEVKKLIVEEYIGTNKDYFKDLIG